MYSAPNPCDPYFILFAVQQQWNNYCRVSGMKYLAVILTKCSWGECDPVLYKSEARFWSSVCFYYCALHGFRANVLVMKRVCGWLWRISKRAREGSVQTPVHGVWSRPCYTLIRVRVYTSLYTVCLGSGQWQWNILRKHKTSAHGKKTLQSSSVLLCSTFSSAKILLLSSTLFAV